MNQTDHQLMKETPTTVRKILDFLIGFLGSINGANLGLLLVARVDPQRVWIWYFKWFWIVLLAGLAVILYARKKMWISIGIVVAMVLLSF